MTTSERRSTGDERRPLRSEDLMSSRLALVLVALLPHLAVADPVVLNCTPVNGHGILTRFGG
jgi:hypothetical protein